MRQRNLVASSPDFSRTPLGVMGPRFRDPLRLIGTILPRGYKWVLNSSPMMPRPFSFSHETGEKTFKICRRNVARNSRFVFLFRHQNCRHFVNFRHFLSGANVGANWTHFYRWGRNNNKKFHCWIFFYRKKNHL